MKKSHSFLHVNWCHTGNILVLSTGYIEIYMSTVLTKNWTLLQCHLLMGIISSISNGSLAALRIQWDVFKLSASYWLRKSSQDLLGSVSGCLMKVGICFYTKADTVLKERRNGFWYWSASYKLRSVGRVTFSPWTLVCFVKQVLHVFSHRKNSWWLPQFIINSWWKDKNYN